MSKVDQPNDLSNETHREAYLRRVRAVPLQNWRLDCFRTVSAGGLEPNTDADEERTFPTIEQISACQEWLQRFARRTKSFSSPGSYDLKHRVESWRRGEGRYIYIPNGAFIIAAAFEGYRVRRVNYTSINARFDFRVVKGRRA
jgi:hypothetical protein